MYEGEGKEKMNGPIIPKKMRENAHGRFEGHCAYCGKQIKYGEMEMDFLLPVKYGGKIEIENLLPSCRVCNRYRKNRKLEQFRSSLELIPKILTRDSGAYRIAKQYGMIKDVPKPSVQFWFEEETHRTKEQTFAKSAMLDAMNTISAFCKTHDCDDCPMKKNCSHQLEPKNWMPDGNS